MKKVFCSLVSILLLSVLFTDGGLRCDAQEKKLVTGRVTNKSDNDKPLTDVQIYAYNTVAEAEDAYNQLMEARRTGGFFSAGLVTETYPDTGGYYEVSVAQNGAILFYTGIVDPILEKVNYRLEINVQFALEIVLDAAKKTVDRVTDVVIIEPPTEDGENIISPRAFPFDPKNRLIHTDSRLVVQSNVIDCDTGDTVSFGRPLVYDGKQYHETQFRRMNFNPEEDPLYPFADKNPRLYDSLNVVQWVDTIFREHPDHFYQCENKIWLEDYNHIYFDFSKKYDTKRLRRPMQFLEYSFDSYDLDPEKYRKHPRREKRNAAGNISLTFLVGKAQLDPADTMNNFYMESLKSELTAIVTGEGSTLKEFHIEGVASPDGPYAKNVDLAQKRMAFALEQITSVLPRDVRARVYMTKKAKVASWEDVADLLFADSLKTEADKVREIARKFSKSMDQQWSQIRALPFYKTLISPRLPKLRSVSYTYVNEIYRELTPAEILDRYKTDEDYRNGTKEFALYEYWHLFNMLKDEKELEALYRRALVASEKAETKKWVLPANNLAVLCIKNEAPDTTILAPFIDLNYPCNYTIRDMNRGTQEIFNPEQVIANQVVMLLMMKKYFRAVQLSVYLPSRYKLLKAITKCLAGYFKNAETEEGREIYTLVRDSSPRNKVVMNLAVGNIGLAKNALMALPQDDPITLYLTCQAICRSNTDALTMEYEDYDKAMMALVDCFKKDKKYIRTAEADWDIFEDILKDAKAEYEMQMSMGM